MGGFVLVRTAAFERISDREDAISKASHAFAEREHPPPTRFEAGGHVLLAFPKIGRDGQVCVVSSDDGAALAAPGGMIYRGRAGREALELAFGHLRSDSLERGRLRGCYCLLSMGAGGVHVMPDEEGTYPVFANDDFSVVSSSLLAVLECLPERRLRTSETCEYILHAACYGPTTPFVGVDRLEAGFDYTLGTGRAEKTRVGSSGLPPLAEEPFSELAEAAVSELRSFYAEVRAAFGNSVVQSFSGGYDSRLLLAAALNAGIRPHLFVYGNADSADVRVALQIAEGEGLEIDHVDWSGHPESSPEEYSEALREIYYMFDGMGPCGVFGPTYLRQDRLRRLQGRDAHVNGGGGEVLRDFWKLPERPIAVEAFVANKFAAPPGTCVSREGEQQYHDHMAKRVTRAIDGDKREMTFQQAQSLYPFLRVQYWQGQSTGHGQQFAWDLAPFADRSIVAAGLQVPHRHKRYGKLEREMIGTLSPRLARYPSAYGRSFAEPPSMSYVLTEFFKTHTPLRLRPLLRRLAGANSEATLQTWRYADTASRIVDMMNLEVSRHINVEKLRDPTAISRALSLELTVQRVF